MLVGINAHIIRSNLEGKALRLRLISWLDGKVDLAGNLVRVHDLESLLDTLRVLGGNKCSEPEYALLL